MNVDKLKLPYYFVLLAKPFERLRQTQIPTTCFGREIFVKETKIFPHFPSLHPQLIDFFWFGKDFVTYLLLQCLKVTRLSIGYWCYLWVTRSLLLIYNFLLVDRLYIKIKFMSVSCAFMLVNGYLRKVLVIPHAKDKSQRGTITYKQAFRH